MRIRTILTTMMLLIGIGTATAPGVDAAPSEGTTKHCVEDVTRPAVACSTTQSEIHPQLTERRVINVIRIWDSTNQCCTGWQPTVNSCSTGWTTLAPVVYQKARSIGYNAASGCRWQLLDKNGANSPWVSSKWDDLATLGTGWRDRAVAFRLG